MTTNDDPKFIEWAKNTSESKSGSTIIVLLNEAYDRGDAGSVAAIFKDYENLNKNKNRGLKWVKFGESFDSEKLFFFDKTSIKNQKTDLRRVWVRIEDVETFPDFNNEYKPTGQYQLAQWESNCGNETQRMTSSIHYNKDSSVKRYWSDEKSEFSAVIPDSLSYAVYKLVCK